MNEAQKNNNNNNNKQTKNVQNLNGTMSIYIEFMIFCKCGIYINNIQSSVVFFPKK